jgi:transcription antitermination factor NusG
MLPDNDMSIWHPVSLAGHLKDAGHVTQFRGAVNTRPEPKMREEFEFSVGSKVRITSGPFQRFTGTITEIDQQSRLVKVKLDIFGRPQPIEFSFSDIVTEG